MYCCCCCSERTHPEISILPFIAEHLCHCLRCEFTQIVPKRNPRAWSFLLKFHLILRPHSQFLMTILFASLQLHQRAGDWFGLKTEGKEVKYILSATHLGQEAGYLNSGSNIPEYSFSFYVALNNKDRDRNG